jgi:hypothetical protein
MLCQQAENLVMGVRFAKATPENPTPQQDAWRTAIETYQKAIPLWDAAGDLPHKALTLNRIGILYDYLDDKEAALNSLEQELEVWVAVGDRSKQAGLLDKLATRYYYARNGTKALEYYEQGITIARSDPDDWHELSQLLDGAAIVYRALGDEETAKKYDADRARVKIKEQKKLEQHWAQLPPTPMPSNWVDVGDSPLKASRKVINGKTHAGLVNRASKSIRSYAIGCVVEDHGRVHTLGELFPIEYFDGACAPGQFERLPFDGLVAPKNEWSDEKPTCEDGAEYAVIAVHFVDGSEWHAEGTPWSVP